MVFWPQFLKTLFWVFVFSLHFSCIIYTDICSSSPILSLTLTILLMSPSKAILNSQEFPFDPFLQFPFICLNYPFSLFISSIRIYSIFIIVIFNFLFHNSKIYTISESGFGTCFVSSVCGVTFLLTCLVIFLLTIVHNALGNSTNMKMPLSLLLLTELCLHPKTFIY